MRQWTGLDEVGFGLVYVAVVRCGKSMAFKLEVVETCKLGAFFVGRFRKEPDAYGI